jgi:predicted porin
MKQKLIATAIAGAVAIPATALADMTITGLLSPSVNYVNNFDGANDDRDRVTFADNQSSIGFKWSEDLGGGNKFLGFIDFAIPIGLVDDAGNNKTSITARDIYAGFEGGWGRFVGGDTSTSWKSSYAAVDPLYRTSAQARGGIDQVSGLSAGTGIKDVGGGSVVLGRAPRMLRYDTPNFAGLTGIAWVSLSQVFAEESTEVFDDSAWGAGLHYTQGPFFGALDYYEDDSISNDGDDRAYAVTGKYTFNNFGLWARFEYDDGALSVVQELGGTDIDPLVQAGIGSTTDAHYIYGGGSYEFTGNNVLYLTYGHRFESTTDLNPAVFGVSEQDNGDEINAFLVAIAHGFSKRTWAYLGYGYNDVGDDFKTTLGDTNVEIPNRPAGDFHIVTAGIKHTF